MQHNCTLKLKVFLLLQIVLLIVYSLPLNATIRYVSKTGNSTPPFITWETAADSIQKCINISVFGDTIYVANGVYEEQVVMIEGLSLIGAGTDSCIVDSRSFPLSNNRTITMQDSCLVKCFYIRSSNNFDYGYGIYAEGQNGLITENRFSNANSGTVLWQSNIEVYKNYYFNVRCGVTAFNSNAIVRKNDIITLTDVYGSGIFIDAFNSNYKPIVDSNYIETRSDGIDKSIGSRPTIKNNKIILSRLGSEGIRVSDSDSAFVYNNLIIAKSGFEASDGIRNYGVQNLQIYNNHILGNYLNYVILMGPWDKAINNVVTDADGWLTAYSGGNFQYKYNDVWNSNIGYGFTPDTTNISVNPMVVNNDSTQGALDYHLQKFSPLIDAGDPNVLDKDSSRSDIGLYGGPYGESYIYFDLPPRTPVNLTANVDSLIKLNWNRNTEADFGYYNVYRDTVFNFTVDSTKLIASVTDTFYYDTFPTNVETLYYKLTAIDNQANESNPSEQVYVVLVSVKDEWIPVNNYILYQNYPNPFNPSTKISYKLKERGYVKLYVYDIKGELVSVLVNQTQEAGYYETEFNASVSHSVEVRNLASGVYIYQIMVTGENNIPVFNDLKKMVYVK